MAKVSTYLNFNRKTEEAFNFYKSVFGGQFTGIIMRWGELPPMEGYPPIKEEDKKLIMHIELPILGGHVIMGTDSSESMGHKFIQGNNVQINLEPDTREEADRLFKELSKGGKIGMPMQEMFWGAYYGALTDKFGINWMINCTE